VAKSVREPSEIVCSRKPAALGGRSGFPIVSPIRVTGLGHTERVSQRDPWTTMARATGAAGLVGIVLVFVPIIALASLGEPPFDATREEVVAFFRNTAESSWVDLAEAVLLLGVVALTWFIVGFCLLLRRAEGEPAWRSTVALVFGALRPIWSQARARRPPATAAPTSTRVSPNSPGIWGTSGSLMPGSAWAPLPRLAVGWCSPQGSSAGGWAG
jgi:hypothetical protein